MWKLCLQSDRKRHVVTISPNASILDLCNIAETKFEGGVTLKHGIPAKVLSVATDCSLTEAGIANQERIIVEMNEVVKSRTEENVNRRPQRAAAKQATETMPAMIAAQEAAASFKPAKRTVNSNKSPRKRKINPSVQKHFANLESARRLKDGARIGSPSSAMKRKVQTNTSLEEGLIESRKNWKEAVNSAYEQNRAAARLAAPRMKIQFNPQNDTTLHVDFPKGIQGRGSYTDSVDWIPREALQAAISASEDAEEGLRPSNLALLSPRVFWALRYHFPADTVEDSLRLCAPSRDWGFLRRRKQQLSQKARDNLAQQIAAGGSEEMNNWEAAADAIAAVEDAMTNSYGGDNISRHATRVQQHSSPWTILTPQDEDKDELYECITGCNDGERTAEVHDIVQKMIPDIRNWRELANCDESYLRQRYPQIEAHRIQEWIDYARTQTLEEIMVEICDGDVIAVERLREKANSGTPRDLVVWGSIIPSLQRIVPEYHVDQLESWCSRAQASLNQFPWLGEFATPLD